MVKRKTGFPADSALRNVAVDSVIIVVVRLYFNFSALTNNNNNNIYMGYYFFLFDTTEEVFGVIYYYVMYLFMYERITYIGASILHNRMQVPTPQAFI